jgi:hypothetical protein
LLSDSGDGQPGKSFFLKLMLAALFFIVASSVVETILSHVLFSVFVPSQSSYDVFETYNLILALYYLGYLVAYFLVFYFIGLRSSIQISRHWLASLEYLFIGALLGEAITFIAVMGINSAFYGAQFGFFGPYTTIVFWLDLIVGFVHGGGEEALVAFAALAIGSFLRPAPGKSATEPQEPTGNEPMSQPNGLSQTGV